MSCERSIVGLLNKRFFQIYRQGREGVMSKENAKQFLEDIAHHHDLRNQFQNVEDPQDFIQVAHQLGYDFTADDLKETVKDHSQGVEVRRKTGIWPWLRTVQWIHSGTELSSD